MAYPKLSLTRTCFLLGNTSGKDLLVLMKNHKEEIESLFLPSDISMRTIGIPEAAALFLQSEGYA